MDGIKGPTEERWYQGRIFVIAALLCVGPFALPFLFLSPRFTLKAKLLITVLVVALTVWLTVMSAKIYASLSQRVDELKAVYGL